MQGQIYPDPNSTDPSDRVIILSGEVAKLTKLGEFWGLGGALDLERELVKCGRQCGEITHLGQYGSKRSSTYYAAGGNAAKRFKKTLNPWWALMTIYTTAMAAWHSHNFRKKWCPALTMSADELDVRAAVLARTFRRKEALYCVNLALAKDEKEALPADTKALLLSRKAQLVKDVVEQGRLHQEAYAINDVSPMTHARVARAYAGYYKKVGEPEVAARLLDHAAKVATRAGLTDQALKATA